MKKHIADSFSRSFLTMADSWIYCRESFLHTFEELSAKGMFLESGGGEKIWETKSKYVLKVPADGGSSVVYKGYRRITKKIRSMLRLSPCGIEALNYQRAAAAGIPVPELLAAGDTRVGFKLKSSFIITRFAQGFGDGRHFLPGGAMAAEKTLKEEFLRRHLELLARFHDSGVIHRGSTPANFMWKLREEKEEAADRLDLLWIDLASCRKLPIFLINWSCHRDLELLLKDMGLASSQKEELINAYCRARKNSPPCCSRLVKRLNG